MSFDDATPDTSRVLTPKPRLVLMGEFSAGKSTLVNILLDCAPLPMRVTATRLPPVRISHGTPAAVAVGQDGQRSDISLDALENVVLEDTKRIDIRMEAEILTLCDLVDMPGISDPNMPPEMWEDAVGPFDHVIWCTHATQAWRQSEAAIWNILRGKSSGRNLLLITQFDKLQSDRDKGRVLKRLERETEGLFEAIYPVSLLQAIGAGDDYAQWSQSGVAAFADHVVTFLNGRQGTLRHPHAPAEALAGDTGAEPKHTASDTPATSDIRVLPRRVAVGSRGSDRARSRHQRAGLA